jgi:hypothetical protein
MSLRTTDFESAASTDSTTGARNCVNFSVSAPFLMPSEQLHKPLQTVTVFPIFFRNEALMAPHSTLTIIALLEDFVARHPESDIRVGDLVNDLEEHSILLMLLIIALFCAIPIPIPGIHVILSLPLFYVTIQQMMGRRVIWLPHAILERKLPRAGFITVLERATPWFHWLEKYVHPRMTNVTQGSWYRVMGAVCFFITCIIVIPLPLTNIIPSIAIAVIALGMLCHDGVVTLSGAILGVFWCLAWLGLVAYIGIKGFAMIHTYFFT